MADLHSSSSALHMIIALVERTCSFSDSLSLAYARLAPQALQQTRCAQGWDTALLPPAALLAA